MLHSPLNRAHDPELRRDEPIPFPGRVASLRHAAAVPVSAGKHEAARAVTRPEGAARVLKVHLRPQRLHVAHEPEGPLDGIALQHVGIEVTVEAADAVTRPVREEKELAQRRVVSHCHAADRVRPPEKGLRVRELSRDELADYRDFSDTQTF